MFTHRSGILEVFSILIDCVILWVQGQGMGMREQGTVWGKGWGDALPEGGVIWGCCLGE